MSAVSLVNRRQYAAVYDGTNGVALAAEIPGATLLSDDGTTLVIDINNSQYELPVNGALIYDILFPSNVQVIDIFTDTSYLDFWTVEPTVDSVAVQFGQAPFAAGGPLGQTQQINVTLSAPMPSVNMTPMAFITANSGILGLTGHSVVDVDVIDTATVRVTVQSAALAVAGRVSVLAFNNE